MRVLIAGIVSGNTKEAQALPREADLAAEFDVSRGVVREALRGLQERGLVVVKHGLGTIVAPGRQWNVLDPDVLGVLIEGPARADILMEVLQCRRIFEIEAAGIAAEQRSDEDLRVIMAALDKAQTAASRTVTTPGAAAENFFLEADIDFHQAIIAATENRVLARVAESIQRALVATRRTFTDPAARSARGAEHQRIANAIASRDPEAARAAMAAHLETAERILLGHLSDESGGERPEPATRHAVR